MGEISYKTGKETRLVHLVKENLVLLARSSFNGFANRRGSRRKVQGKKEY